MNSSIKYSEKELIFMAEIDNNIIFKTMIISVISVTPLPNEKLIDHPTIAKCGKWVDGVWDWRLMYIAELTAEEILEVRKLLRKE